MLLGDKNFSTPLQSYWIIVIYRWSVIDRKVVKQSMTVFTSVQNLIFNRLSILFVIRRKTNLTHLLGCYPILDSMLNVFDKSIYI